MSNKVNELNINITKAVITSVTLRLGDEGLLVEVSGSLLTDQGKKISSFNFANNHWQDEMKFDLPFEINMPAKEIFKLLTPKVYAKINGEFRSLSSGKQNEVKNINAEDELNPDDIPF